MNQKTDISHFAKEMTRFCQQQVFLLAVLPMSKYGILDILLDVIDDIDGMPSRPGWWAPQ